MSELRDISARRAGLTAEQRARLAQRLRGAAALDPVQGAFTIAPIARPDNRAALSFAQQRQWFLWQLDPESTAYHVSGGLVLEGQLDAEALRAGIEAIVARHESLRTVFEEGSDGVVQQLILPPRRVELPCIDLCSLPLHERAMRLDAETRAVCDAPFDLACGPLFRAVLIRLDELDHRLVVVMHHIISDGWSIQLILDELAVLYRARALGCDAELPELPVQYADYAAWQRRWLEEGEGERQLTWWRQHLGEDHPMLALSTDHPRRGDGRYSAARYDFKLPADLLPSLKRQAQAQGATLFMALLAAFNVVLFRHSGQSVLRVGVPIANRNRTETAAVVGFFVNTQVLSATLDPRMTLADVLSQSRDTAIGAQSNQDLPFEQLVEALRPDRAPGINPLFQVMFNHLRQDHRSLAQWPALSVRRMHLQEQTVQFELMLQTCENELGEVEACFNYAPELFDAQTMERMAGHWLSVLRALVLQPGQSISEVALMGRDECAQLDSWSINAQTHGAPEPVHRLIERQARLQPFAPALVFGEETLSYAEVNRRANRLAHWMIGQGVRPETLVGVALERSTGLVIALLAIMKAGGAYVPLDPEHPADRIAYMVEDSALELVLTNGSVLHRLPAKGGVRLVALDAIDLAELPAEDPGVPLAGENLAYVIYTSGSTGKPKGAANRHNALHNRLAWMQQAYGLGPGDTVLQKTPFSFDVSVWEFFWPLMYGARLAVAAPGDHRDPARLVQLIRQYGVSTLHFVPSMLQAFLSQPDVETCTSLRRIVCSGEALPAEAQNEVFRRLPRAALYNLYGPTEAAIDVTHWTCSDDGRSQVAIGRPISGVQAHVLDASLNRVPLGVAGELYLGGIGLARGYAKRPGLTAERFIADPFDRSGGGRLYRTGDLVRWNSEGQLDYLGRLDHQVKIRGLRIELGEIEAQLLSHPRVREAVVVVQQSSGGPRLAGYVSLHAGLEVAPAELREWLGRELPEYMVPALLMTLECLPLNANGKIDRKALPQVQTADAGGFEAPEGARETMLAGLWRELLGVREVGRNANFFESGGHSLMAAQLVSRLRANHGLQLPLREVFEHPVLRDMAPRLRGADAAAGSAMPVPALVPVARAARMGLSPMQHRLWLVDRLANADARAAYNMAAALRFEGPLDIDTLRRALETIVSRHEALRTVYPENDQGDPVASITPAGVFDLPRSDVSPVLPGEEVSCIDRALDAMGAQPFDLSSGPPLRAALLRLGEARHALLLCVHHIAFDGWSQAIFASEFAAAYEALRTDSASTLPPLRVQYADYAAWQVRQLDAAREQDAAFWKHYLANAPLHTRFPVDSGLPPASARTAGSVCVPVERALVGRLAPLASGAKTSMFTVMLTAFLMLLHRETDADDVVVGTDVAGRDHPELEKLIGFFVNVVPLRSRRRAAASFAQWLAQVHDSTQSALAHAAVPLDRIIEAAGMPRTHGGPVRLLFVMQNTPASHFEIPGLRIDVLPQRVRQAKFDIAVFVHEGPGDWSVEWIYDAGLYRPESIGRWAARWCELLRQLAISPDTAVEQLFSSPDRKEFPMNPMPSPQLGKLDKLKKFAAKSPAAAEAAAPAAGLATATQRSQVKTSFLSEDREFPLVIEPAGSDFDAMAWVREHRGFVDDALARHGGLLFRGFGLATPQDFEAFAENVEPELYGSYGDLPKKEGGRRTYRSTPYPERQMILYHNESSHMERWPRKQWFYCELPSRVGGATPIVDCREMLRRLPADIVEAFERKALIYVRTFTPHLDVSWRDFFKTDQRAEVEARLAAGGIEWRWLDADTLQTRTHCPAVMTHPLTGERVFFNQVQLHHPACLEPDVREDLLALVGADRMPRHVCYGDGSPIDDETMAIVGRTYEECAVRFDWRKGDVVMLDNMLAAHARDPYEGPRKIVVAMGAMFERAALRAAESDEVSA